MAMQSVGDRRERLERLRDQLAGAIEGAEPNMLPQLAGQYRATLADLAALAPEVVVVSKRDELKERREGRSATSSPAASTGTSGKQRRS